MTINALDLVRSLAGAGAVGLVLWALTQVGERWPWYQALSKTGKQLVAALFASVVGLTAWAAVTFLPDPFWVAIQAPFSIVATIVGSIIGSDLLHFLTNKWGPAIQAQALALQAADDGRGFVPYGRVPVDVSERLAEIGNPPPGGDA